MIEVISPGMYTSIQDEGRKGYRKFGVPLSGTMDRFHAQFANTLVGNDRTKAVLECTLQGPKLLFNQSTEIAICGAEYHPKLNNDSIAMNRLITVNIGDILFLGNPSKGMRGYIAVRGGICTKKVMGSRSMYASITKQRCIQKGDSLPLSNEIRSSSHSNAMIKTIPSFSDSEIVEVYPGPEYFLLSQKQRAQLTSTLLLVTSQSNRMGILLDGLEILGVKEIITAPVQPGTVQLTPSGKCIVLMRDAQTTGGYARVLQLSEEAINRIAQKRPTETVCFQLIEGCS